MREAPLKSVDSKKCCGKQRVALPQSGKSRQSGQSKKRAAHRTGATRKQLAEKHGVDRTAIGKILTGVTWKHLIPDWAK